jgi:hypothetical protein
MSWGGWEVLLVPMAARRLDDSLRGGGTKGWLSKNVMPKASLLTVESWLLRRVVSKRAFSGCQGRE